MFTLYILRHPEYYSWPINIKNYTSDNIVKLDITKFVRRYGTYEDHPLFKDILRMICLSACHDININSLECLMRVAKNEEIILDVRD